MLLGAVLPVTPAPGSNLPVANLSNAVSKVAAPAAAATAPAVASAKALSSFFTRSLRMSFCYRAAT
jgi:hypothetical protein